MTRFPEPGQTKTRLIPALGSDRAAELHRCLIMFNQAHAGCRLSLGPVELRSQADDEVYKWLITAERDGYIISPISNRNTSRTHRDVGGG